MNIRLSCYANRQSGKNSWTIEKGGKVITSKVFKFSGDNIKKNVLTCLYQGLRAISKYVTHQDTMYIDIQNVHLTEWLSGQKEYKGYDEELSKVFEVLEGLDCRYCFQYVKKPFAMVFGEKNSFTKPTFTAADDLLDMEETE